MKKHLIPLLVILLFLTSAFNHLVIGFEVDAVSEVAVDVKPESTVASGPMDSPWPMKCHDNRHTSQSPYSTSHVDGLEKWRVRCDSGGVNGGIAIDKQGVIYFGDSWSNVYAYYPNGTLKWKFKTDGNTDSTPALAEDGTLFVASWDAKLYAFNSTNGKFKWKVGCGGGSIATSPAIAEDGTIYVGTLGSGGGKYRIVAINSNGTIKWYYPVGNRIYSGPAIGDDGTIYIGSDDRYLYAMNPNGTLKWCFETGDVIKATPSIANDGTIYIGSYDDYLYALNPNGTMKWRCKDAGTSCNPAIADDGMIYVSRYDKFLAIHSNGTIKWIFNLGGGRHIDSSSCAISGDGTIYVGASISEVSGGLIIAINQDGTEKWSKKISSEWCESSPSIAEDGIVYIGSFGETGGYIHAFGPVETNNPPEPPTISGKINGKVRTEIWYTFRSIDPENNPISWYIEWGDGTNSGWTSERASGEDCYYGHTWLIRGDYTIRAKAKDTLGEESDWAYLEITMPKNQKLYQGWFERFPILQKILDIVN